MKIPGVAIDAVSACSVKITMFFDETQLAEGTAFFWRAKNKTPFLVTNWHNVTGRNNQTNKHLSETLAEPNSLRFQAFHNRNINRRLDVTTALYKPDGSPAWLEHPKFGRAVDVVCLSAGEIGSHIYCLNDIPTTRLAFSVGADVYVIGYPRGLSVEKFPLWKRGTVASEPGFDVEGLPLFYVDCASTKGMSGSPVIMRSAWGPLEDGTLLSVGENLVRNVGIYSGRVQTNSALDAQIGRVWKIQVLDEIIPVVSDGETEQSSAVREAQTQTASELAVENRSPSTATENMSGLSNDELRVRVGDYATKMREMEQRFRVARGANDWLVQNEEDFAEFARRSIELSRAQSYEWQITLMPAALALRDEMLARLDGSDKGDFGYDIIFDGMLAGVRPLSEGARKLEELARRLASGSLS